MAEGTCHRVERHSQVLVECDHSDAEVLAEAAHHCLKGDASTDTMAFFISVLVRTSSWLDAL